MFNSKTSQLNVFVNDAQQMSLTVHYHTYKHDDWSRLVKYGYADY